MIVKATKKLHYSLIISHITVLLIPLIILGSLSFFVSSSIVRKQTVEQDESYLNQISNNVDSIVKHMKSTSLIAYSSTLLQEYIQDEDINNLEIKGDENIHNYLYSLKSADYKNYTFILKSYNKNTIYCNNYDYLIDTDYDFDNLIWIQRAISLNDSPVFVPTYSPDYYHNDNTPVFSVARQLNDNYTLTPLGYIIINCNASTLDEIVGKNNSTIFIFDEFDRIVYPYNTETPLQTRDFDQSQIQNINGANHLVTKLTSDESQLTYIKITPYSEINKDSNLIIQLTLLLIVIAAILTIIVTLPFANRISFPINKLVLNMSKIKSDNYETIKLNSQIHEMQELNDGYNLMLERINDYIQNEYMATLRQKDMEYKLLHSQINPHFLFNTLESIRMMAAINDDDETASMIFKLANLYRYGIRTTETFVTLEDELNHIQNYISLQKMRFGDKFKFESNIDPDSLNAELPHLTLQPLIENSLVHGFKKKETGGIVHISSSYKNKELTLIVSDNGQGMDEYTLASINNQLLDSNKDQDVKSDLDGHIGLAATFERIKYHYINSSFKVTSTINQGSTIQIKINYDK